jgi:hypothetical protein
LCGRCGGEGDGHCGHECVEFHIFSPFYLRYCDCFCIKKSGVKSIKRPAKTTSPT